MKRILTCLFAAIMTLLANAKVDVDYSSRFEEGTNTIQCTSAWGWHSVTLGSEYEVMDAEYLYISYEASCNFNLILQDPNWQNAYSVTCSADNNEGYIKLTPGAYPSYSCIVIQNHAEGEITINKIYFCSEDEFYNPAPDDLDGARTNLIDIYLRYQKLLDQFVAGDDYGQYPADLYQKFVDALDAALILDDEAKSKDLTVEQLNAMSQAIVDAYKALIAAKKVYLPADGYYRFRCARQFYEGDEETGFTYLSKGMYSDNSGTNGWKTVDETDPTFLWTLERQPDNNYILRNAANKLIFSDAEKSSAKEKTITFDALSKVDGAYDFTWPMSTEEDVVVFNFRFSDQPANDYKYIHANWHSGGSGWGGPMTVWCNTTNDSGASEWYLEPIDEAVAQEMLNANYNYQFAQTLNEARSSIAIAEDMKREKLITEADQFSSPFSQNDLGSRDGADLSAGALIDGKTSTFWHSVWSNGSVELGTHYLQIELPEEIGGDIEFDFSRREISSDHVTQWGIYGSNNPEGEKFSYEWIADINVPYGQQGESLVRFFTIEEGKQYQYLRFYAEQTTGGNGFFHLSEMQLYALSENENSQAHQMGDLYTNLVNAIATAENVDQNNVSKAEYEALKSAYDAFMDKFVDPTPLREAIRVAEPVFAMAEIGDNPGQWSQDTYDSLVKNLNDAKAYDEAGKYTKEESSAYEALLANADRNFLAAANKVSADKFYTIRFASEDKYEEHYWSTSNVLSEEWGDLFDTYLCPAESETLVPVAADEIRQGAALFFTDDANGDIAFRFVPVGENQFIIQHQASGLFIHCYGRDSWTGLTLNPTLFTVEAVGYGENIIRGIDYEEKDMACLHAQLNGHRLVTWHDDYVGCNSGLIIEEIDATAAIGQPLADYKAGEVTTMCYPVSVQPCEGSMFTVVGTYTANDKVYVAMNKVEKADAGQPVVYIAKGVYDKENEEDVNTISLAIGTDVVAMPLNDGALQGTYSDLDLSGEAIIFAGDKCEMSTEETAKVYANHAYIVPDGKADANGSYSLVLEVGSTVDGISHALSNVARQGDVFDMSGRLVRSGATLNDVHSLPQGIYILNGVKILVK